MKKFHYLLLSFLFLVLQAGIARADKDQVLFSIQKVKSSIEKAQAKSDESKVTIGELNEAREYLTQAEAELKLNKNKSLLGSLKKEAEPKIVHLTEMADIDVSIVLSKLEKIDQEKDNELLEKLIPKIEAQIKVFDDKNAEIKRLQDEIQKPKDKMAKLEKTESEKLTGKVEALNEVVASLRKDLSDKIKAVSDLTAENKNLKDSLKSLETRKGSDLVGMQTKLTLLDSRLKSLNTLGRIGLFSNISESGYTLIIPRKKLFKAASKGYVLLPESDLLISGFADSLKRLPGSRLVITAHGFGQPPKKEDSRATESMASALKDAFVRYGISESSIQSVGAGSESPLFSKGAVEENRCVEITVYQQPS